MAQSGYLPRAETVDQEYARHEPSRHQIEQPIVGNCPEPLPAGIPIQTLVEGPEKSGIQVQPERTPRLEPPGAEKQNGKKAAGEQRGRVPGLVVVGGIHLFFSSSTGRIRPPVLIDMTGFSALRQSTLH